MDAIGSLVRGLVLAVLVAAVAGITGALGATFLCTGGCAFAEPAAALVSEPAPALDGSFTMASVLGVILFLGLVIVLAPREPVTGLAVLFAVLIAALAFLLWLPRNAPPVVDDEPSPPPAGDQEPEAAEQPQEERAAQACPAGQFLDDGRCVPCTETIRTTAPPALRFQSARVSAHWRYASESVVELLGTSMPVERYVAELADNEGLCDAPALLVIGSASADGSRERNERRAMTRASRLADAARRVCGDGVDVYALSLGQSQAAVDLDEDRKVSVLKVAFGTASDITGELLIEELGYALGSGEPRDPLLAHRDRFPRPWTGPGGEPTQVRERPRPQVETTITTLGAPETCDLPRPLGLDARPALRQ